MATLENVLFGTKDPYLERHMEKYRKGTLFNQKYTVEKSYRLKNGSIILCKLWGSKNKHKRWNIFCVTPNKPISDTDLVVDVGLCKVTYESNLDHIASYSYEKYDRAIDKFYDAVIRRVGR